MMQCIRCGAEEAQRCICLIVSTVIRGPGCGLIMVRCRVRLPLLVISSAVVLIFSGQGMAVSNEKKIPRRNNRRNNKLPSQETPEAPLPLGHSRRRSRPRKLGKALRGMVFTGD